MHFEDGWISILIGIASTGVLLWIAEKVYRKSKAQNDKFQEDLQELIALRDYVSRNLRDELLYSNTTLLGVHNLLQLLERVYTDVGPAANFHDSTLSLEEVLPVLKKQVIKTVYEARQQSSLNVGIRLGLVEMEEEEIA